MERALNGGAIQEEHDVGVADLPFEFMMNALRLVNGFRRSLFDERTGLSRAAVLKQLDRAESLGLIQRDHERVDAHAARAAVSQRAVAAVPALVGL